MPKGRKSNDGRGRLGGRKAGTPNQDKPLKVFLREHSLDYFTPNINAENLEWLKDKEGNTPEQFIGRTLSQYEIDLLGMKPTDRVKAEIDLLKFHTPQMQATAVDMTANEQNKTLSQRLSRLANGEEIPSNEE